MPVKLRLARHGAKKRPFYRIVAADSRARRDGRFLELLGTYDPAYKPAAVSLKRDRVTYWLSQGAQPTDTVNNILTKFMDAQDTAFRPSRPRRTPKPAPAAEAAPPVPEAPKAEAAPPVPEAPKVEAAPPVPEAPKAETAPPVPEAPKADADAPAAE